MGRGIIQKNCSPQLQPSSLYSTGAQSRNRTSDTQIFSLLLYRLSYLGLMVGPQGLEPWTYRL